MRPAQGKRENIKHDRFPSLRGEIRAHIVPRSRLFPSYSEVVISRVISEQRLKKLLLDLLAVCFTRGVPQKQGSRGMEIARKNAETHFSGDNLGLLFGMKGRERQERGR